MSQRFEEDFNELGLIYEAFAKKAGGQSDLAQGNPSFRKGYMQPGGGNRYAKQALKTHTAIISDEEYTSPLLNKVNALIKEAEGDGMDYAVHQLTALRAFIEENGLDISEPY
jgi:hypothetical protein